MKIYVINFTSTIASTGDIIKDAIDEYAYTSYEEARERIFEFIEKLINNAQTPPITRLGTLGLNSELYSQRYPVTKMNYLMIFDILREELRVTKEHNYGLIFTYNESSRKSSIFRIEEYIVKES